ncbi:MAG: thiamine pyrophosphate-dependent dehydrogenase E1 component subunit alpha [Bradyrhizobiaceae bacterium]|nr:thiamine pyrophosphate-dependent dehydrogenase E1 component subunit alpha [Bradyrhizobiaceae bacterium]
MNSTNLDPTKDTLVPLLRRMLLIRRVEERLSADFHAGKLPGGVHLYIGQEAVAAGVCAHLRDSDTITSTHRGHGHFLAKGGSPRAMMAEIWGKQEGICRGMGGSMHVADVSKGILGANGIVAAGLAIATGSAFAAKLDKGDRVAVCFFGDGASNQGTFMECLNVSTLWQLPTIFVCENNNFSEFSPTATVTAGAIIDRARAFKIPCTAVDGNDVLAVWRAAGAAVEHARKGGGPSFIEAHTYRLHGHLEAEKSFLKSPYREDREIEEWRQRDPLRRFKDYLTGERICDGGEIDALEAEIAEIVEDAARFAEAGEPADPNLVFDIMFHEQRA